jgi:hypothetical protein
MKRARCPATKETRPARVATLGASGTEISENENSRQLQGRKARLEQGNAIPEQSHNRVASFRAREIPALCCPSSTLMTSSIDA